ncbi:hypothetical protein THUN1379_12040 [Paludibacterium sp. THUN1379]|uniref:sensor histidine kinase n=1 Tax=Paludibacterium sp. THUN1379 TaxID=3112107 RepID=UPI003089C8F7|nr:hypothetical protein THUN1379_12040 [Paludibacterium sp. THUN1379]
MHPILADVRKLLLYGLACLLGGLVFASLLIFSDQADTGQALLFALPLSLLCGFALLSAYPLCRARPAARRTLAATFWLFTSTAVVWAGIWLAMALAWNVAAGVLLGLSGALMPLDANLRLILFLAGVALYLLSLLTHEVLIAFGNLQQALTAEAESRLMARDAEMRLLRSQIDPHFLFNSLNSISALTSLDPAAARDMTIDLAQFFRRTVALSGRDTISLSEELALCEHYLAIEQRRFGSKLQLSWQIDPAARPCQLPPLTLQPLLENALKHGIRQLDQGGTVHIEASLRDTWLHLAVSNPLPAAPVVASDSGHGLNHCQARLGRQYEQRARLTWQRHDGQFRVEITLPSEEPRA